jgi:uncharacterized protein (DUF1800 family)
VSADDPFLAAHRFGFGPAGRRRPAGRDALLAELADPALARMPGDLPDVTESLGEFIEAQQTRRAAIARQASAARAREEGMAPGAMGMAGAEGQGAVGAFARREVDAKLRRLLSGEADFIERLVLFWTNHFAVSAAAGGRFLAFVGPYEREAIRPHLTGRFRDMLHATTRHAAMLAYLDNVRSVGPNSPAGRRGERGLNENLAREVLELHTLGVDGGYTQEDVTAFAAALTGWSIFGPGTPEAGRFRFAAPAHEPGPKTVLGQRYAQEGEAQGAAILDDLARHPATARHVAGKLAAHFVADDPPPALVARLVETFRGTDGDLAAVTRTLLTAPEAWAPQRTKLRNPMEFLVAAARTSGDSVPPPRFVGMLANLGQPIFRPPSPKGFPDRSEDWLAPDAIKTRADFAIELAAGFTGDARELARATLGPALTDETLTAIRRAETPRQGLAILLMAPEFQRR